jgi:hypothetical protein
VAKINTGTTSLVEPVIHFSDFFFYKFDASYYSQPDILGSPSYIMHLPFIDVGHNGSVTLQFYITNGQWIGALCQLAYNVRLTPAPICSVPGTNPFSSFYFHFL